MQRQLSVFLLTLIGWSMSANSQTKSAVENKQGQGSQIVFVCEHGAALSVVSAAYFNKIAKEEHLNFHAIARGTEPQPDLSVSARKGLEADGIPFETTRPQKLFPKDAANARRIVTFTSLPAKYSSLPTVEKWTDVPPTAENYGRARDAILRHLRELIRQLKSEDR